MIFLVSIFSIQSTKSNWNLPFTDLKSETTQIVGDDEFDEFGFKIDVEDGPEQSSSKLLSTPFQDNPQQRWEKSENGAWII